MEEFLSTICTLEWHVAHDLGQSTAESCEELALEHPEHAELIRAWGERSEDMIDGAIDESVSILAELRAAEVRCYALSNMEPETFPLSLVRFVFLHWFVGHVITGHEGLVRLDIEIFG